MQRILLTGMSGVGKSTVAERLSELGYKVVETDHGDYSVVDEHGVKHWDVDRVRELLATEDADVLFVVGSDDAQVLFYPDFDQIVLLRAPRDVMVERLASRSNNLFGKSPEELARILADLETFEPSMRRACDLSRSTPASPSTMWSTEILGLIRQPPPPERDPDRRRVIHEGGASRRAPAPIRGGV